MSVHNARKWKTAGSSRTKELLHWSRGVMHRPVLQHMWYIINMSCPCPYTVRNNKVPEAQRCCCWAHIRCYWLRAKPKGHEKDYTHPAVQGFLYCNKLFEYERSYREKGLSPRQIYHRRLKDQKPVIEAFLSWLDQLHPESGDRLIKAINYSNGCRPFMMNYLKDGACSLSNNLC